VPWKWLLLLFVFLIGGCNPMGGKPAGNQVPRISIEDLKARLGSSGLIVLDVRQPGDWSAGKTKIKDAIREDPGKFDGWRNKYPRDKTLVLYCS